MQRTLAFLIFFMPLAAATGMTADKAPATQATSTQTAPPAEKKAPAADSSGDLNAVLARMNQSAGTFKTAQGDFEFETYQRIVDEKDVQKGHIYFRRTDKGVDAAFNIAGPAPKQVVYKDGKVNIFEPKINQLTVHDVSKNKSDVEAFLSLGFGARGDDLLKDYAVEMSGWELVGGVKTAKLVLIPKSEKLRHTYNKIVLWIDPEQDILLQQQFFEPSQDYRLAHYTNMKRNAKVPDDAFHVKTNGNTRTIIPQ